MKKSTQSDALDVCITIFRGSTKEATKKIVHDVADKVIREEGCIFKSIFYMVDGTPMIRAILSSKSIQKLEEDPRIFSIQKTAFFSPS